MGRTEFELQFLEGGFDVLLELVEVVGEFVAEVLVEVFGGLEEFAFGSPEFGIEEFLFVGGFAVDLFFLEPVVEGVLCSLALRKLGS